jgi:hypothetical protein
MGIDPLSMIKHLPGYQVSNNYGIAIFMSLICCIASWFTGLLTDAYAPWALVLVLLFWMNPFKFYLVERRSIVGALYRSLIITEVDLSEVILCDILTSYSRIMCQMTLETIWFAFPTSKYSYHAHRGTLSTKMDIIVPLLIAYF